MDLNPYGSRIECIDLKACLKVAVFIHQYISIDGSNVYLVAVYHGTIFAATSSPVSGILACSEDGAGTSLAKDFFEMDWEIGQYGHDIYSNRVGSKIVALALLLRRPS